MGLVAKFRQTLFEQFTHRFTTKTSTKCCKMRAILVTASPSQLHSSASATQHSLRQYRRHRLSLAASKPVDRDTQPTDRESHRLSSQNHPRKKQQFPIINCVNASIAHLHIVFTAMPRFRITDHIVLF